MGADVADPGEVGQESMLPVGVASGFLTQVAQVAVVAFGQQRRGLLEIAGGALVVAGVPRPIEHPGALLPRRVEHRGRGRPAGVSERPRRGDRDLRRDAGADEQRHHEQAEQRCRRVAVEPDAGLGGERAPVPGQQDLDDPVVRWLGHAATFLLTSASND